MLSRFRYWLIRLLARGDSIVLNTRFILDEEPTVHIRPGKRTLMVRNCFFDASANLNE